MPAIALLTVALLAVAALLNGIGAVGVMAPPQAGAGQHVELPALSSAEQLTFSEVDRAIQRLDLQESGRAEPFEAYEQLLLALAEALPVTPDDAALERASLLLSKSLPAPAASEVVAVLPSFLRYQQTEKTLMGLSPGAPGDIEGAYLHLQLQNALLRDTLLGEPVSAKLYSTRYRMTRIHLLRRMLMQRQDLEEDEKRRLIRQQMEALRGQGNPEDAA
jgi:hypothetical protein